MGYWEIGLSGWLEGRLVQWFCPSAQGLYSFQAQSMLSGFSTRNAWKAAAIMSSGRTTQTILHTEQKHKRCKLFLGTVNSMFQFLSHSCMTFVWLFPYSISPHWKCGRAARASGPSPHQAGRAIAQWSLQRAERNKKSKRTFPSNPCISCRVSSYPPQKVRLPRVVNESTGKLLVDISMHQGLVAHKDIGPQLLKHCTLLLISPNSPLWGPAMPWGWCPQDFQWALQRWEDICALQVVTLEVIHEYHESIWIRFNLSSVETTYSAGRSKLIISSGESDRITAQ